MKGMSMSEDTESQQHELLALASIYDEDEFHRNASAQGGEMHICSELPPDFKIVVKGTESEDNISFLPLLTLNFQLPPEYPSSSSPRFTLSTTWLTRAQMSSLCRRLDELWEENQGSVVLFTWFQFLKEEALDFLGIQSPLEIVRERKASVQGSSKSSDKEVVEEQLLRKFSLQLDPRAVMTVVPHGDILPQLLDFDEAQRQKVFDGKVFSCTICFTEKLGSVCLCFKECQHVYCKACMTEYFQIQIQDGNVQCLSCPTQKCSSVATPLQVKQLVDEELFARYDRLLLQSALDLMEDVVYCPRKSCATAVLMEPDRTMAICSNCCYAFCVRCKLAYHAKARCRLTAAELSELKDEYLSASKEGNKLLEKHFGKRVIQNILEDSLSLEWVDENCKPCPYCGVNIQKPGGCDKMTCTSCNKDFCWLCLRLVPKDPYKHKLFSRRKMAWILFFPCRKMAWHGGTHTERKYMNIYVHEVVEEQLLRKFSLQLDPRAVMTVVPHGDILPQLLDFDEAQRQKVFDGKVFSCTICFTEKLGSVCLCFKECQHVYCKACMTEYFQIQIQDGNVQCLSCPTQKCSSVATPLQVKQLVDEELFARYDRLLLQSALDLMEDVVYCPRKSCATVVLMEPDRTMAICSNCCYAFCVRCKLAYHAKARCRITAAELSELKDEYLSTSKEGKKLLEKRFGKRVIQKILEDSLSSEWVDENCKPCPYCGVNIQKQEGCNKMTCRYCNKDFCWEKKYKKSVGRRNIKSRPIGERTLV